MPPPRRFPDHQIATATNTPEGNAYVRNLLAPKIKAGVEKAMAGQLNGSRPVRLDIVVKNFAIASAVQRILIGGGREMTATANLVDARTGAVIIANPDLRAFLMAGQGCAWEPRCKRRSITLPRKVVADQVADRLRTELSRLAVAPGATLPLRPCNRGIAYA